MSLRKSKLPSRILVTAGPTREMLDPVRFITNLSTGEMGYALARAARRRGARVTLISGPTALKPPRGIQFVSITTVEDLRHALQKHFFRNDLLFMAAAVGDFLPLRKATKKIPRKRRWTVTFRQAPDLVATVAKQKGKRIVIGFSLETGNWMERSRRKWRRKHLDGIVANYYSAGHDPFGRGRIHVVLIDARGTRRLRLGSKGKLAEALLDWASELRERAKN